ncbi:cellulose biosynthesis protein BcsS [Methylocystis sp. MJC1]|jgi:hypothetical protein|uniref:cellulose biosynthesis protein BcsS n=1 Tax=Methylocystis sp. MJC1 TaxID=2654282 RepID=UPI0013ED47A6|nr:cellulose biosynthesis protein BcsS [Methylocystis sp. MJC1]KAF2989682.1 hypothetical protein MJC1_03234 [Methylocystis sp. MJC1]MBU6525610.1 cellulose biosynthesis protein BcsS [Methylocystis sp. MJC1]UZX12085.1 cellulose biosynthesis protein BcsS [Methylocystis sp. MJC1]
MRASLFLFVSVASALSMAVGPNACAADWYTGAPNDGPPAPKSPRAAIDISFDGTTQSAFSAAVIGTIAPFTPLDRSGFRLRAGGIVGSYIYNSAYVGGVHGNLIGGAFLMGYEWVSKQATVAVYAGGEIVNNSISPNDPNNQAKGTSAGLKLATDFYVTPTDATMIAGVFSYSTNFNSYYGRLKFGMALADRVYIGPEFGALGDNFFQQWRLGGHVTGIRLGMLQFGAALGFLNDRVRGGGLYGTVDSRVTF